MSFEPQLEVKPIEEGLASPPVQFRLTQDFSGLVGPKDKDTPVYRHWFFRNQQTNSFQTVSTDAGYPDYWFVYVLPAWSSTPGQYQPCVLAVFQAAISGTYLDPDVALAGGGYAKIPGVSETLTCMVYNAGAPNYCSYGIVAVRKVDTDIVVDPGSA